MLTSSFVKGQDAGEA